MNNDKFNKKVKKDVPDYLNGLNLFVKIFSYRPIAIWLVRKIFIKLKITPNQLTYFEMFLFMISIALIGTGKHNLMITGALFGPICVLLDYLDGTLARARGIDSEFGKKIDAANNHLDNILIPMAATSAMFLQTENKIILLIGAVIVFNTFMFTAGIKSVSQDGQLQFLYGREKKYLNKFQRIILEKTGINIGFHTLFQYDTMFFVFWICCIMNVMIYAIFYLLAQSFFRLIYMLIEYKRKYHLSTNVTEIRT